MPANYPNIYDSAVAVGNLNETYEYRIRNVEIYIAGSDYVEYDHKSNREILRRPATSEEIDSLGSCYGTDERRDAEGHTL
jgi:hypothetical protein